MPPLPDTSLAHLIALPSHMNIVFYRITAVVAARAARHTVIKSSLVIMFLRARIVGRSKREFRKCNLDKDGLAWKTFVHI